MAKPSISYRYCSMVMSNTSARSRNHWNSPFERRFVTSTTLFPSNTNDSIRSSLPPQRTDSYAVNGRGVPLRLSGFKRVVSSSMNRGGRAVSSGALSNLRCQ